MEKRDERGRLIDIGFGSTKVITTVSGFDEKKGEYFTKTETHLMPLPDPNIVYLPNLGLFY